MFIAPFFSLQELCLLAYSLCLLNSQCIKLTTILTAIRTDLSGHDVSTGLLVWSRVIWHGSAMPLQHYYYTALFNGMVYCFCSASISSPTTTAATNDRNYTFGQLYFLRYVLFFFSRLSLAFFLFSLSFTFSFFLFSPVLL